MVVQIAKVGRVPHRVLAGWVADDSYHIVIGVPPPGALGEIRYPSQAPGSVQFPPSVAVGEAWEGWVDGLNVGDASGNFRWYLSSTSDCTGDLVMLDPETIAPGDYSTVIVNGTGPADIWICWMRYVP